MKFEKSKHTVFIADDHEIIRLGLEHCIASEPSFEVVGEASNGLEAYKKIILLEPEIAIIVMPQIDGIELVNKLSLLDKPPKTILITAGEQSFDVSLIFESQANGFLLKGIRSAELILALNKVIEGNYVYSKGFFSSLNNGHRAKINTTENGIVFLTNLQKAVIAQRLRGRDMNEIAREMNLSPSETMNHISALK